MPGKVLLIACGAIARELVRVQKLNEWRHIELQCLPPELHNRPEKIPAAVLEKVEQEQDRFERIFVAYADCGTGGLLDQALRDTGVERIPGAHCYEFLAGSKAFHDLADEEPGSFYLTDFLVRHFDRLVWKGLGLDRQPELSPLYFGNYRRVVYIAQTEAPDLQEKAAQQAQRLGLAYEYRFRGDQPFSDLLQPMLKE